MSKTVGLSENDPLSYNVDTTACYYTEDVWFAEKTASVLDWFSWQNINGNGTTNYIQFSASDIPGAAKIVDVDWTEIREYFIAQTGSDIGLVNEPNFAG